MWFVGIIQCLAILIYSVHRTHSLIDINDINDIQVLISPFFDGDSPFTPNGQQLSSGFVKFQWIVEEEYEYLSVPFHELENVDYFLRNYCSILRMGTYTCINLWNYFRRDYN